MYIKLNFQIFILTLLLLCAKNIEVYSIIIIFIGVHEFAHIITSLLLGFKIESIKLNFLGFSILLKKYKTTIKKITRLFIILAGPGINIILAIIFCFINIDIHLKEIYIYSNLLISLINLIPIFPLDGGRIIKEILSFRYEKYKVIKIIEKISYISIVICTVFSGILIFIYKNITIFFSIIFLWWLVLSEFRKNRYRKIAYKVIQEQKR